MKKLSIIILIIFSFQLIIKPQGNNEQSDSDEINNSTLYKAIAYTSAYYAVSLLVLNKIWYKDRTTVPFHFYNDNRAFLQVDKFGHMFGSYVYSYVGFNYLLNSGHTRKEALLFGATLGLLLQSPIEIMDGIHEGYGFSWGDMAANTMGSALIIGQELLFNEQLLKLKYSYSPSVYADHANGYLGSNSFNRILKDYNGHTYWLSLPVNKIIAHSVIPDWLCVSAGYGADGMYGEFENIKNYNGVDIPETQRFRQYLLSLDIDWPRIKTDSGLLRLLFQALSFIKFPFPAIEYNSMGNFKLYWLYF